MSNLTRNLDRKLTIVTNDRGSRIDLTRDLASRRMSGGSGIRELEGPRSALGEKSSNAPSTPTQVPGRVSKPEVKLISPALGSGNNSSPEELDELGSFHCDQFESLGERDDIEKAVECFSRALALTPDSHSDLLYRHANLGVAYTNRFQRLGNLDDLEKAIEHDSFALALTPAGHPDLPHRHSSLGVSYSDRFQRLGEIGDLETAIEHDCRALDLTPPDHPDLAHRHSSLGVSYGDRFQRLGELGDLEKAIEHDSRALALTPDGHPDLAHRHSSLGVSYGDRFQRLGGLNDLEKALKHDSHAFALTPAGHPDLAHRHSSLGVSYGDRFKHLGELDDLENAIKHKTCALDSTPDGSPALPHRHAELGLSYGDRFRRLGGINDLEKAIEHKSCALAMTPNGHPALPYRHSSLAASYSDRFRRLGDMDDLEKSIEHNCYAINLTPNGHPNLGRWHADLGASYTDRFQRLGKPEDLEKSIEHSSSALKLTPDGHPGLLQQHLNLAISLLLQYQRTNDPSHSSNSLDSFRRASQLLTGVPRDKFRNALLWARNASTHHFLNCMEAYQITIELLPQYIWLGATANQRYQDLLTAENLAINAAFTAIRHARYDTALEWLEHGRCVVWNQSLMLRSPLDRLHSSYPDLATRIQAIANDLQDASYEASTSGALDPSSVLPEQLGQQRRRLAQEYNDLLVQTRNLPGFEQFLRPTKSYDLLRAARNGSIVVINCHLDCCDALIILPGQRDIKHLNLPDFTEEKARNARSELAAFLRHTGLRQRGVRARLQPGYKDRVANVLFNLWNAIVKPVLDFLGLMNDVSIDPLPHITWCPTGVLSFLPLHAAGDYEKPRSRAFDYAISSYTPTLTALLASALGTPDRPPRVLAIGQERTPGHTPLPGTTRELGCVKNRTQDKFEYTELTGDQATTTGVLDAMEQHDWVHLACHAHQNVEDPTKSGFYLHDGTLDLTSINRRSFMNKGLAFLSACQTAAGDEKLPDESIHLASGMLIGGYASVVATMWSVVDDDAPFVADKVYAELMKEGSVGHGSVGIALHYAVAALRDKVGKTNFGRWVPYIHIGS